MRDQMLEFLRKEIIGPDQDGTLKQDNGEEILQSFDRPTSRYISGALFPRDYMIRKTEEADPDDVFGEDIEDPDENFVEEDVDIDKKNPGSKFESDEDEILNLANSFLPSAVGMSVFMTYPKKGVKVNVNFGVYNREKYDQKNKEGEIVEKDGWFREQINFDEIISESSYPSKPNQVKKVVIHDDRGRKLILEIRNRSKKTHDKHLITFSLINESLSDATGSEDDKVFFQVELKLQDGSGNNCFYPMPEYPKNINDDDVKSNNLLYRKKKSFGAGHGCSVKWNSIDDPEMISLIETTYLPTFELKPIIPTTFKDIKFSMFDFSDFGNKNNIFKNMDRLITKYSEWIDKIRSESSSLNETDRLTAEKHLDNCESCLKRMTKGLDLLKDNNRPEILRSFQLMNRAMLLQQLRYSLKKSEWKKNKDKKVYLDLAYEDQPDPEQPETWPDWNKDKGVNERLGNWRPFQIAYILMNITSIIDSEDPEHDIVDLIWFPTGGGKTEAYLGMSSFLIFYRKLIDKYHDGTLILMRYTLRLLTSLSNNDWTTDARAIVVPKIE